MGKLNDKVVLVVGDFAAFGAGPDRSGVVSNEWAIVSECAREGSRIVVGDVEQSAADEVALALRREGFEAAATTIDVTDEEQCCSAATSAVKAFGKLDGLVNTIGDADRMSIDELSAEDFAASLRSIVLGNFHVVKAALPHLRQAKGALVTFSSLSAIRTGGAGLAYETCKAALLALTRNVALSEAKHGVRANSVLPGALDSAALRQLAGPTGTKELSERIPAGRLGQPAEMAKAVAFLLSDDASFITGTGLLVDGGMAWRI